MLNEAKTYPERKKNKTAAIMSIWEKGAKQPRMPLGRRGQNNNAHRFGEGGKTTTHVSVQVDMSISCFPPAQLIPLRIIGCGGPA